MSRKLPSVLIAVTTLFMFVACGDQSQVGGEIELDKIKGGGGGGPRLGENLPAEPGPEQTKLDVPTSPTPAAQEAPKTAAPAEAPPFEVGLTTNSPYYEPGQVIRVPVGTRIRITNKDDINRHPHVEGLFDSGPLAPGATFMYHATVRTGGQQRISDRIATFKVGYLEVY
jgi:hypothetical protein